MITTKHARSQAFWLVCATGFSCGASLYRRLIVRLILDADAAFTQDRLLERSFGAAEEFGSAWKLLKVGNGKVSVLVGPTVSVGVGVGERDVALATACLSIRDQ
jgi:hypothetical protein